MIANTKGLKRGSLACAVSAVLLSPSLVTAKSVTVTGEIETKKPVLKATQTKVVEAYVEPISVVFEEGEGSGCLMTPSQQDAIDADNIDELVCQYDFQIPFNLERTDDNVNKKTTLTGFVDHVGTYDIPITTTFFSGSKAMPVDIPTDSVQIHAVEPVPLNVVALEWEAGRSADGTGDVYEINTPLDASLIKVKVSTEDKSYSRFISLDEYDRCDIEGESSTSCSIALNQFEFGSADDRYGEVEIAVRADATNEYFTFFDLVPEHNVTIKWDSRLAEHVTFLKGGNRDENSFTLPDGQVLTAEPGEWIQVLKTPHWSRTDDWWHPSTNILMTPLMDNHETPPSVIIKGMDYSYLWQARNNPRELTLRSRNTSFHGEYVALKFDTSPLVGAEYTYDSGTEDQYGNGFNTVGESVVDNLPIEFLTFVSSRPIADGTLQAAYFPKDIEFAMYSRFRDLSVKSAEINGESVTLEDVTGDGHHWRLASFPTNMVSGEDTELDIVIEDSNGDEHEYTIEFIAQPFEANVRYDEAYTNVQRYSVDLRQASTRRMRECKFYTSLEDAKRYIFQTASELHCYIEWLDLDPSMETEASTFRYNIYGIPDTPNPTYQYRVHFVDIEHDVAISEVKELTLTGLEVPPIGMEISNADIIEEDNGLQAFAVPVEGGIVATVRATAVNADAFVIGANPFGEDVLVEVRQSGPSTTLTPRSFIRVTTEPGKLWQQDFLNMSSGYVHDSSHNVQENIKMVYVPNEKVEVYASVEDSEVINTIPHEISVGIGEYIRATKTYTYDPSIHGEWIARLELYDSDTREWLPTDYEAKVDQEGNHTFTVDMSHLQGDKTYRYRAVAEIISEYEAYSRTIESRNVSVRVHKGGPVIASIDSSRWVNQAPFRFRSKLVFPDNENQRAFGSARWYYKDVKATNWTFLYEEERGQMDNIFDVPANYEVKAVVKNRYTGVEAEAISENILSYAKTEFDINFNQNEYLGQDVIMTIDSEENIANFDIEWSMDKCTDWTAGGERLVYTPTVAGRYYVCARLAYKDTQQALDRRWTSLKKRVNVIEADPVRIRLYTNKTSEVGFNTRLEANIDTPQDIRHKLKATWLSPSGVEIPSEMEAVSDKRIRLFADYVVTAADLEANRLTKPFMVKAEIEGINNTFAQVESKMDVLFYEFPNFELTAKQDYLYFPTQTTVLASMERQPEVPMNFTYEWLERTGNRFESASDSSRGSRAKYDVTDAGYIKYAVLVTDERGNEKVYETFTNAEAPGDADIKIDVSYNNRYMRYPLDISARATVKYEHRRDRIESFDWYVNGEKMTDDSENPSIRLYYTAETSGNFEIRYIARSEFGAEDEQTYTFTVVDNIRPVCTLDQREDTSSYLFRANCRDEDGKIVRTLIEIPELDVMSTSREHRVLKSRLLGVPTINVTVTAWDDSNETGEDTMRFDVPGDIHSPPAK